jgi:hypothetical protein
MGDKAKPLAVGANSAGGFAVSEAAFLCRASHFATSNSDVVSGGRTRPLAESSAPPEMPGPKPASLGDEGKAVGVPRRLCCFEKPLSLGLWILT